MKTERFLAAVSALVLLVCGAADASFHLMQIEQVLAGVNGDTSAQAIQLRMRADGQNFVFSDAGGTHGPAKLVAYDAAGANPVTLLVCPSDVSNGATGRRILITSANFAHYTTSPLSTDFTMTNLIPDTYLSAGRITWEDVDGAVLWSVAYGGSSYTGPTTGSILNDSDGDYGKLSSGLPTASFQSLLFNKTAIAKSTTNASDYNLTLSTSTWTNNANQSFLVPEPSTLALLIAPALLAAKRRRR